LYRSRFKQAIEGNQNKLIEEIDVNSGLWTALQAKRILTSYQLDNCQSQVCQSLWLPVRCEVGCSIYFSCIYVSYDVFIFNDHLSAAKINRNSEFYRRYLKVHL